LPKCVISAKRHIWWYEGEVTVFVNRKVGHLMDEKWATPC
jgi:hypothetical protein